MAELARNEVNVVQQEEKATSLWKEGWIRFRKNKMALIGSGIVLFFILLAIFAPFIAPYDMNDQQLSMRLQAPSKDHIFGTDDFGRDIFSRVVYGARISLWVGFFSVLGSVVIGSLLGIIAGYYGRWVDAVISR
ncbi:MAG: ABC transporter permease, partial [Anoxybacillus ayderensis]|nr:ABC transporter permease [Anoxybacillus ayderensis]